MRVHLKAAAVTSNKCWNIQNPDYVEGIYDKL